MRFANSRGGTLAGNWHNTGSARGVVLAHGFTGDKESRGRFDRMGEALAGAGYQALAFDFAGCGESDDDVLTVGGQEDDLRSATRFLRERGGVRECAWYGHSLGSYIALRAWTPEIATLVVSGALTGPMVYDWERYFSAEQREEWAARGRVTVSKAEGPRRTVVVDGTLLDEFGRIDQRKLLAPVGCPVLLVHGDGDEEERALLENSRRAMALLPAGSRLVVEPGAGHGFDGHYDAVIEETLSWLAGRLPG